MQVGKSLLVSLAEGVCGLDEIQAVLTTRIKTIEYFS